MQQSTDTKADPAADVVPEIAPVAPWRMSDLVVIEHGRLRVTFNDGSSGEVDVRSLLESLRVDGTVFEDLRDPEVFSKVTLCLGAPCWPNGADLAPDAIHESIQHTGVWTAD